MFFFIRSVITCISLSYTSFYVILQSSYSWDNKSYPSLSFSLLQDSKEKMHHEVRSLTYHNS